MRTQARSSAFVRTLNPVSPQQTARRTLHCDHRRIHCRTMTSTLHLAAWNINHRTGRKSIPPDTLHAIAALDIDVLVLTESVSYTHLTLPTTILV